MCVSNNITYTLFYFIFTKLVQSLFSKTYKVRTKLSGIFDETRTPRFPYAVKRPDSYVDRK